LQFMCCNREIRWFQVHTRSEGIPRQIMSVDSVHVDALGAFRGCFRASQRILVLCIWNIKVLCRRNFVGRIHIPPLILMGLSPHCRTTYQRSHKSDHSRFHSSQAVNMRLSVFRTAAVAASFLPSIFAAAAVPPVDGVQSIADSLGASAQSLSAQVGAIGEYIFSALSATLQLWHSFTNIPCFYIAAANAAFNASAGGSASVAPTVDLSGAISGAISTFWQTAFDVEKKVCTIVFTINPGTIAQAQASLIAGYVFSPDR